MATPDGRPRPRFTVRRTMVAAAIAAVSSAIVFAFWKPFFISYHERKMASDWATVEWLGASDGRQGEYILSAEFHRDSLVKLGHFERRAIPLKHLQVRSSQARAMWADLNRHAAGLPVVTMQGYEPETPATVVVWARPKAMAGWEAIVAKYDRPSESDARGR